MSECLASVTICQMYSVIIFFFVHSSSSCILVFLFLILQVSQNKFFLLIWTFWQNELVSGKHLRYPVVPGNVCRRKDCRLYHWSSKVVTIRSNHGLFLFLFFTLIVPFLHPFLPVEIVSAQCSFLFFRATGEI